MSLSADQLGDLRRKGYQVKRTRGGLLQASNTRHSWKGSARQSHEDAWSEAGAHAWPRP